MRAPSGGKGSPRVRAARLRNRQLAFIQVAASLGATEAAASGGLAALSTSHGLHTAIATGQPPGPG